MLKLVDYGSCHYVGGFCYGVLPHHQVFRLGPFNFNKDVESKLSNLKIPPMIGTCKLQHLGGGYFILLSASRALLNGNLDVPQPNTRKVMINIFKELLPTAGASTQVDTASFNAKIVFSQNYFCKTEFPHGGEFLSCFLGPKPCPQLYIKPPFGFAFRGVPDRQVIEDHEPFEGEALFRDVPTKNDRS